MDKPLISVIVPIYNVEKYLPKCIDSLVGQSYPNLEIVLVDDESPDRCGEICDEYAKSNKNIKVLHQKNQGVSAARNNGVKISTGEYISFVDPDDYVTREYIDVLYSALIQYDADMSAAGIFQVTNEKVSPSEHQEKIYSVLLTKEKMIFKMYHYEGTNDACWGKLYKRSIIEANPFPVGKIYEDLITVGKIVSECDKIVYSSKCIYYYVKRENSILSSKLTQKHVDDGIEAAKQLIVLIQEKMPSEVPTAIYKFCSKIYNYMPRMLGGSGFERQTYKRLQMEITPYIIPLLKDRTVSTSFKMKCVLLKSVNYTVYCSILKTVYKRKGSSINS